MFKQWGQSKPPSENSETFSQALQGKWKYGIQIKGYR